MQSEYQQVSAHADYMDNPLNFNTSHYIGGDQSVLKEYQLNQSYQAKSISLMQQNFISYLLYIVRSCSYHGTGLRIGGQRGKDSQDPARHRDKEHAARHISDRRAGARVGI